MRTIHHLLLVEDDVPLLDALLRGFSLLPVKVTTARSVAEACKAMANPVDVVVVDVRLPDGTGLEVCRAAMDMRPIPMMVAVSGEASPQEAFQLAQGGASAYLAKPVSAGDIWKAIQLALKNGPPLGPLLAACVGHQDIRQVETQVRAAMLDQALALAGGNQGRAARLLKVSRQAVARQTRRPAG